MHTLTYGSFDKISSKLPPARCTHKNHKKHSIYFMFEKRYCSHSFRFRVYLMGVIMYGNWRCNLSIKRKQIMSSTLEFLVNFRSKLSRQIFTLSVSYQYQKYKFLYMLKQPFLFQFYLIIYIIIELPDFSFFSLCRQRLLSILDSMLPLQ